MKGEGKVGQITPPPPPPPQKTYPQKAQPYQGLEVFEFIFGLIRSENVGKRTTKLMFNVTGIKPCGARKLHIKK